MNIFSMFFIYRLDEENAALKDNKLLKLKINKLQALINEVSSIDINIIYLKHLYLKWHCIIL